MKHIVEKHRINDADTLIAMSDINGEFFVYIPNVSFWNISLLVAIFISFKRCSSGVLALHLK